MMKGILLATAVIGLWLPPGPARAGVDEKVPVAILVSVTRLVRVKEPSAANLVQAAAGASLLEGSQVVTLDSSRAEIKFRDGHFIRLAPNTSIVLSRLPRHDAQRSLVHLLAGRIRALVDKRIGEGDFGVYGMTTITAVKGTNFDMMRNAANEVTVAVNEGRVTVAELKSESAEEADKLFLMALMGNVGSALAEGNMMNVMPGKPFPSPVPIPPGFPNPWADPNQTKSGAPGVPHMPGLGGGGFGFP